MSNALATIQRSAITRATTGATPYLTPEEIREITEAARAGRNGERNALLIQLLWQTGLRISEALAVRPCDIEKVNGVPALSVKGKGRKLRKVSLPVQLGDKMKAYAYEAGIESTESLFPIRRAMAWRMIRDTAKKTGIMKRVHPHIFRHSDAIERLRQTGNPRALQLHLGHSSPIMTMRYLSTLQSEDALKIMQDVRFEE